MTVNGNKRHRAVSEGFLNGGDRYLSSLGKAARPVG